MLIHHLQSVIIKLYLEELKGNKTAESVSALSNTCINHWAFSKRPDWYGDSPLGWGRFFFWTENIFSLFKLPTTFVQ